MCAKAHTQTRFAAECGMLQSSPIPPHNKAGRQPTNRTPNTPVSRSIPSERLVGMEHKRYIWNEPALEHLASFISTFVSHEHSDNQREKKKRRGRTGHRESQRKPHDSECGSHRGTIPNLFIPCFFLIPLACPVRFRVCRKMNLCEPLRPLRSLRLNKDE